MHAKHISLVKPTAGSSANQITRPQTEGTQGPMIYTMRKTRPESSSQKNYNIGIYSITFYHFIIKPYTEIQVFMKSGENKYLKL